MVVVVVVSYKVGVHDSTDSYYTQDTCFFDVHPDPWENDQFDEHIFQIGWSHQP